MNISFGSAGRRAGSTGSSHAAANRFLRQRKSGRSSAEEGESPAVILSRWLAVAALFYAAVQVGAVDRVVQYHVCLAVLASLVMVLVAPSAPTVSGSRRITGLLAIACAWLLLTALQTAPLPAQLVHWLSPGTAALRENYVPAISGGGSDPGQTLSLVPARTQAFWPIYAIALAFFWVGLATGNTRRGRAQLLAALAAGGTALAVWGLVQRARGSHWILPSRPAPDDALPFATLAYKNAGASLLIAALAAAVGLWLITLRPLLRQRRRQLQRDSIGGTAPAGSPHASSRRPARSERRRACGRAASGETNRQEPAGADRWWLEPQSVAAMLSIAVIVAGLAASLSRGAWIAAAVALVAWAGCCRRELSASVWGKFTAVLAAMAALSIGWFGVRDAVASRAAQMDWQTLGTNDRIAHWRDAVESVTQYPWFGAGLGTYGYAHLPQLDRDMPRWFYHAHNQPLEWAVETGVVGVTLLTGGLVLLVAVLVDLYRQRRRSSTPLIWFSVGVIAVTGLLVQSCADFVVLTPAVMWTYALLLGVVCRARGDGRGAGREKIVQRMAGVAGSAAGTAAGGDRRTPNGLLRPLDRLLSRGCATAAVFAVGALLLSQSWLQDHVVDQRLLEVTQLPASRTAAPSARRIQRSRALLEKRLEERPHQAQLWQRLAVWEVLRYRRALMTRAQQSDPSVRWVHTELRALFQRLHSLEPAERGSQRRLWLSEPQHRRAVALARQYFARSLGANPLVPQVHLQLAWLSPLTGEPSAPPAEKCRRLSTCHRDLQFELGLLAREIGDHPTMVDQWRRCLRYAPEYFEPIFHLADDVLTPRQFVANVLPVFPGKRWMTLVRRSMREDAFAQHRQLFLEEARRAVAADPRLLESQRHVYLARLCEHAGELDQSIVHWQQASQADPFNADLRYRHAKQLLKADDLQEARHAATLGRALEPGKSRFPKLLQSIDRRLVAAAPQLSTRPTRTTRE